MSEERKTIYLCLVHTVVDGFNIIFGTHLVRIFEAKIYNFYLSCLKLP